ncbi:flavin reductase family protein [Actinocorallia lasiicapitis]
MGRFPTGVTLVTTVDADGRDHAMTMSAFSSVSLEPLLVLFCVEKIARFHDVVLARPTWAVSILGEDSADASAHFATRGRSLEGAFDGWSFRRGPVTGAPIYASAVGALECRTHAAHDAGDHTIVVGEVLAASTPAETAPLVYHDGGYRALR